MKAFSIIPVPIILLLLTSVVFNKSWAQPFFVEPVTCISANPETSVTDYKLIANGFTITDIDPLGDLEIISINQTLPTTNDVIITARSFNKGRNRHNDCEAYLRKTEATNYGFGKAVIRVRYGSEKCINYVDQEIFKIFEETPPIKGPTCVSPGEVVTYHVCPILTVNLNDNIGIDEYFWNEKRDGFPAGLTELYRSSDNSSITFLVTDAFSGGGLYCRFGRCNKNYSVLDIGVKTMRPQMVSINGASAYNAQTICVPTSSNTVSLTVTAPVGAAYTYSWSTNNSSWSFGNTGAYTASTVSGATVQLNINESAAEIYLTTIGGCGGYTESYRISRTLTSPLLIKRSDTINCVQQGSNIIFSINNAASLANLSNINFTWSVPPGWQINGSASGPVISTTAGQNSGMITATSSGCSSSGLSLFVKVKPSKPSGIAGPGCITTGISQQNYSVVNTPGYTYFWNNTAAWISSGTVNNSITYNANTANGMPNIISVRDSAFGGCFSDTVQKIVYAQPFADSIKITGCWNVGVMDAEGIQQINTVASTLVFSVNAPQQGATYSWAISPSTGGYLSSTTGNSVVFNANGKPGIYTISVSPSNTTCGTGAVKTRIVTISPNGKLNFVAANPGIPPFITGDYLYVTGYKPASTFAWLAAYPGTLLPSGTGFTNFYLFYNSVTSGTRYFAEVTTPSSLLSPSVSDSFVCKTILSSVTPNYGARASHLSYQKQTAIDKVMVLPNPASSTFTLQLPSIDGRIVADIYNSSGKLILTKSCKIGSNVFNVSAWPSGEYLIQIKAESGEHVVRKLIVGK